MTGSHDEVIVGGLYALKTGAFHWCVDGILKPRQDGLVEVRHTGAGFMAVKREVFERMIEAFGPEIGYTAYDCEGGHTEHDFFRVGVFHEQENKVSRLYSEDWGFCERARELGYKIYVDPKIALKHIGQASYPLNPLPVLCKECLSLTTLPKKQYWPEATLDER
jgi:hypothetical protein